MNRRGLLHGILAAGMAPAIGTAGILMPVRQIVKPRFVRPIVFNGSTFWVPVDAYGKYAYLPYWRGERVTWANVVWPR